ncbi:hypothetical protein ACKWTF_010899 [Chironomus riparius]
MDIPQKCLCDEKEIKNITEKNLTIIVHMKKMDGSNNVVGSGTSAAAATAFLHQQSLANNNNSSILSGDTNNNNNHSVDHNNSSGNENNIKSNSKSESSTISCGKKAFYKLIFNKSSGSNNSSDNNNNSNSNQSSNTPPLNNSYTKVSMERTANGSIESKISQMSIDQNRQSISSQSHQGNSLVVSPTSNDLTRRYNSSSLNEYRIEDSDERARIQRAIEIQEGIEIDQVTSPDLIESLTSHNSRTSSGDEQQEHCKRCQQNQIQYRQMGIVQQALLSIADDENNPRYHSQVAYCHYLVPDLEKITACCYYWGKMDRYEAEKLLEGKPEGTFLLRDSAQDDYLFSVSFRKYGRSLHARIEQFNHKFSFDSHDPSVFMAFTVTGLVEHYKDPTSVMFFEPMLTSPLHRNHVFSLQQLCRAAIVSHTSYDGINKLSLPLAMKNYLKEYHYKLRVRVKQFPEGVAYQNS